MKKIDITIKDKKELTTKQKLLAACRAILYFEKSIKDGEAEPSGVVYEDSLVTGATITIKIK